MTKADLVKYVATKTAVPQNSAGDAVDAVTEGIINGLVKDDSVKLGGLGTFKIKETKARTARNPKTGVAVQVPAKKVVKFVPAKELKDRIQG